jgi:hypothetical protein
MHMKFVVSLGYKVAVTRYSHSLIPLTALSFGFPLVMEMIDGVPLLYYYSFR